jgi:hypothetical protein
MSHGHETRGVAYASGMEGFENAESKALLKAHGRLGQLHSQSKHFRREFQSSQRAGGAKKSKKMPRTNATRWDGCYRLLETNNANMHHVNKALVNGNADDAAAQNATAAATAA